MLIPLYTSEWRLIFFKTYMNIIYVMAIVSFYQYRIYDCDFVKAPMNMIDFLAIVPFYLSLLLEGLEDFEIIGKAGKIIRLVKVAVVVRIFVEHSSPKMHILLRR